MRSTAFSALLLASGSYAFVRTPLATLSRQQSLRMVSETVFSADFENTAGIKADKSGPLEKIILTSSSGEVVVYPYGAVVASYTVDGHDCLFVRPDAKMDGSKPISGGLPHCWPQFGPGKIQQHGFARNLVWKVESVRPGSSPSLTLELTDTDETRAMWPHAFKLLYTVTLASGRLATHFKVINTGDSDFDFTTALHSYFRCSDVSKVAVKAGGFLFAEYLDKMEKPLATKTLSASEVTISSETDSVFYGVSGEVSILDGVTPRKLRILNGGGWTDTVVWNPFGNAAMGADNFLCVESAKVKEPVVLKPGAEWVAKMDLIPTSG